MAREACDSARAIRPFRDGASEDLFNGRNTRGARNACPKALWKVLTRKLDALDSAERLARYFRTSAGFWMNLQLRYDLYETERSEKDALEEIEPLHQTS